MKATLKARGREYQVTLHAAHYGNGNLAIFVNDHSEGYPSPFAKITVNLCDLDFDDLAFVDTNNCPWVEEFITGLEIAFPTGIIRKSGYCEYPQYQFDLDELQKYSEV